MNPFKKSLLVAVAALAFVGQANATPPAVLTALPEVLVLASEVGTWIAEEWQALREVLLSVPRAVYHECKTAVSVFDASDRVMVTATNLSSESSEGDANVSRG